MAALVPGKKAPAFQAPDLDGILTSPTSIGPGEIGVLAFFKATCPTCILGMPFLGRIFEHHKAESKLRFYAVAEEPAASAQSFNRQYGITIPTVLDDAPYEISDRYGLTNVPTVFLLNGDGTIAQTIVGFVKKEYEELAKALSDFFGAPSIDLFTGANVPELKPG